MFEWFYEINKPELMPPFGVFRPVWGILYLMMATSLVFYLRRGINFKDTLAITMFIVQLLLNFAWTPVFFIWHNLILALIICILLDIAVLATLILFYRKSKTAGILLIPYFIWCLFATYLTFEIVRLNPQLI